MDGVLYFDGCSKGNPGPSGSGAMIQGCWSDSEYVGITTNNVAEYKGLILGLKEVCMNYKHFKNLTIKGDSMLVINHMTGKYKVKAPHLIPLYNQAKELTKELSQTMNLEFLYVPREQNKEADSLANDALKEHFIKPIFGFY
jgi:ribonuclease HI